MNGGLSLTIAGETLVLHPERAVLWPARRTVIVADTHFGKSGLFRHHGFAVPAGSDEHDRRRLSDLVQQSQASRLLILGDFLHAPLDADGRDARDLTLWSESLSATEICVIAGNHDRGARRRWLAPVTWLEGDLLDPPFRFLHDAGPDALEARPEFTLSGHIHPVVRLGGLRKRAPRVPIFWLRRHGLVLPSFGVFTGGYVVTPAAGESVFAVGSESVVQFPLRA